MKISEKRRFTGESRAEETKNQHWITLDHLWVINDSSVNPSLLDPPVVCVPTTGELSLCS